MSLKLEVYFKADYENKIAQQAEKFNAEKTRMEEEKKKLEQQGILHALRRRKDLEEAAGAYKDIEKVIRLQEDLVDVLEILQPLAVIKG